MSIVTSVILVVVLICIGGVFSAAEMALVTLRDSQVQALADRGKRGQAIADLRAEPNRFLSAVQIGVTLAGFLSASVGGATLSDPFVPYLERTGMGRSLAQALAVVIITVIVSYFSIVIGELTSKRLAMQRPETFALALAPLVNSVATVARPVIWLLGRSTNALVRLLGGDPSVGGEQVSEEELRAMVASSDTLSAEERQIVDDVFNAGERSLREVMVPRTEVDFLPADMPAHRAAELVRGAPRSRYPVSDGSADQIIGFVHVRDLMTLDPRRRSVPVRQIVRPIMALPETVRVLHALTEMRRAAAHLAVVRDEYGGTAGIVTLEDLVEELVGDITDEYDQPDAGSATHGQRNHIDGLLTLEDFAERFGYVLPEGPYDTVAGYFMAQLGQVPRVGDSVTVELDRASGPNPLDLPDQARVRLEVTEVEGRRASWLVVHRVPGSPSATADQTPHPAAAADVSASSGGDDS